MSPRFWLFSLASAGSALMAGLGLGLYATTPPRVALADGDAPYSAPQITEAEPDSASLNGPSEIRCTGCGPTLAQRQMAAMVGGGWSGYDDPLVRDYMAQDYGTDEDQPLPSGEIASPSAPQLPDNVERFAAGEYDAPPPMQLAQGGVSGPRNAPAAPAVFTSSIN